ncbi:MAG: excinuclease ABC subunit UvrC [Candidatus Omnitrophica bacterium]|nr:excinuclease ABC subunit UvrC [Candidatus Omnitrophota bacterium]MDD5429229.1 excinuclease ABC subunit UvrC [Candidatus Omnitrophota bacterium]
MSKADLKDLFLGVKQAENIYPERPDAAVYAVVRFGLEINMAIKEIIKKLPSTCGVYIMKTAKGKVIYIGKATDIRKRVASHFFAKSSDKADIFSRKVAFVDFIECLNPEQALILEAALIKEKKPYHNIALRDGKSYPYVEITNEPFPRIFISRSKTKSNSRFFGPYPRAAVLKSALNLIRRIFPYRSCRRMPKKPCLFYHLRLCPGPCLGDISCGEYAAFVREVVQILKGERKKIIRSLNAIMEEFSARKDFEKAVVVRNRIMAINDLYEGSPKPHEIISLKETLHLSRLPLAIEAFDISSLGRYDAVGSLVVFFDGFPDKKRYRRFLIKSVRGQDDYAMIEEVVRRRYLRVLKERLGMPDLIIIDGGKGHVDRAHSVLQGLGVKTSVVGLAKGKEQVWFPNSRQALSIPRDEPCLHLIQRVRDEAHRFAHSYQLLRRKKRFFKK